VIVSDEPNPQAVSAAEALAHWPIEAEQAA